MSHLPSYDINGSIAASKAGQPVERLFKVIQDLDRYRRIIAVTKPDVLVECGTHSGRSAKWFIEQGVPRVITIDIDPDRRVAADKDSRVTYLVGSSIDPKILTIVDDLIPEDSRVMVSLDSDHSASHVEQEILLWAPRVSPGCYLVVEDGIFHWMPEMNLGDPLVAIEKILLQGNSPGFTRDVEVEGMDPISTSPAGWWRKNQ